MIDILLLRPETDWRLYPTVFLCAFLIFGIIELNHWAFVRAALVTAILYYAPVILCGSVMLCLVLSFVLALINREVSSAAAVSQSAYVYDDPHAPIQGAVVTEINGHTVQIDAKGLSFLIWKEPDGTTFAQELNKQGYPIGSQVSGAPNAWQFGMSIDQSLAEWIKLRMNQ